MLKLLHRFPSDVLNTAFHRPPGHLVYASVQA